MAGWGTRLVPAGMLAVLLAPALAPALAADLGPGSPGGDVATEALAFADLERGALGVHPQAVLQVRAVRTSLTAEHAWLEQRLGPARVEDGGLAYHRPLDGSGPWAQSYLAPLPADLAVPSPGLDAAAATSLAHAAVGGPALRAPAVAELVLSPGDLRLQWVVGLAAAQPRDLEVRLDAATGAVLRVRDAALRAEGRGSVFQPNPIASSGNGQLRDHPLGLTTPAIAAEVQPVALHGLSEAHGQFGRLVGPYVKVLGAAFEPSLRFHYLREDPRFEEVAIYHHVDQAQRLLQGHGFHLSERQVEASNYPGEVNAFYSRLTRTLHFGYHARDASAPAAEGLADAAEDGEVVVHEYGHAVLDDMIPGLAGLPGEAIHEAFADFLAWSSLSRHSGGRFDSCLSEWMSQYVVEGDPPCIRDVDNARRYPQDWDSSLVASPHENGLIWGGALWDLHEAFPREDVERVAIEAHFFLATVPEMPDVGQALLAANRLLGAPLDEAAVRAILAARGLLGVAPVPHDDAGSGHDAGNHYRAALPVPPGRAFTAQVGAHGDREDWFAMEVQEGDLLVVDLDAPLAGPAGFVPPTEPPIHGTTVGGVARLGAPALRGLGPLHGCDAEAGDIRFTALATESGTWRMYVPEPSDNDPLNPTVVRYGFAYRLTRDYAGALPGPRPEVQPGTVFVTAQDELWVRLDGAASATIVAPSGRALTVSKSPDQAVLIAHVALDGTLLGFRQLVGAPATVTVTGNLAGEPADGTWLLRKGQHMTSGAAQGLQLRVAGKVLDDVAPQGEPIEGSGLGGPSGMLPHVVAWNWHKSPARFDTSTNDTLVPRPPVSYVCPRFLTA